MHALIPSSLRPSPSVCASLPSAPNTTFAPTCRRAIHPCVTSLSRPPASPCCRFYTLIVLSTALFDRPAFKNVIVNGLVLAADGKKMSKRLKNYPDPELVINAHGADALRLYLINSPVVRAEELRFREEGVKDVVRDVLLPWSETHRRERERESITWSAMCSSPGPLTHFPTPYSQPI